MDKSSKDAPKMNVMKAAILAQAEAFSKIGDREKIEKRAEELRAEIDAAFRETRRVECQRRKKLFGLFKLK